ncbi:MAG: cell division protein FtsZ [Patescibacteria group bacterium]
MPQVKPEAESFTSIKVVGVGGGGGNAIDHMIEAGLKGVEFIAVNTDAQDLHYCKANEKIHIGKNATRGLGAGMDPELGRQAAEESKEELARMLDGADMVFITGGKGGGTCTGAAPFIAELARSAGALTIAVVTKPFSFEGSQRAQIALEGIEDLKGNVDSLIVIHNDRVLNIIDRNTSLKNAFYIIDDILFQAVQGISDLITLPGIINVDFADVRAIMKNSGAALIGVGHASGDDRAVEAAKMAISSPLVEMSINGARRLLISVSGGSDISMSEINKAAEVITNSIDPDAKIIFGAFNNDKVEKGVFKITIIATGFDREIISDNKIREVREIYKINDDKNDFNSIKKILKDEDNIIFKNNEKANNFTEEDIDLEVDILEGSSDVKYNNKNKESALSKDNSLLDNEDDELSIPTFIRNKMKRK